MKTKVCSKCKKELPATTEYFAVHRSTKSGLQPNCKECAREYDKKYYENNKTKRLEYGREYSRRYRRDNKEKIADYNKKYYKEKKERIADAIIKREK